MLPGVVPEVFSGTTPYFTKKVWGAGQGTVRFRRRYPKLWKTIKPNWDEEFRRLEVIVKVKASLRRMGLTLKPTQNE